MAELHAEQEEAQFMWWSHRFDCQTAIPRCTQIAIAAIAACFVASLVFVPGSAQAASWSILATPNGLEAEQSVLYDVACDPESTNACIGVGKQTISGTSTPYAQYWNGSTWANQSAAAPEGASASELQADHCLSKTSCVAAGSYTTKSGTFSLAESWNGTSWLTQTTPNPVGATETKLKGISCNVITACIAVGNSNAEGKWAVAMLGNSGKWSLQTVPKPAGAISSELNGVECTSATSCVAVGGYNTGASTYWGMATTWNGTEWSLQTVPKPSGSTRSMLLDVSCSSGTACTAVGGYWSSGVQKTFVARWDGKSWTHQTSPNPVGSANSVLQNVSCTQSAPCVVVGDWLSGKDWQPMAQYWNGAEWLLETTPLPSGAVGAILEGVSCRVTCLTTGWYTDSEGKERTLGEIREIWKIQETPQPKGEELESKRLRSVSCPSSAQCVAVAGSWANKWNGTKWENSTLAAPPEGTAKLRSISCPEVNVCTAVGSYITKSFVEKPLAERWNGTEWKVQTTINPEPKAVFSLLSGVSCTASNACTAVGWYENNLGMDVTLAERWNGTEWKVQSTVNSKEAETDTRLRSVSCSSSEACQAVGESQNNKTGGIIFSESWNGAVWAAQTVPVLSGVLGNVSCSAANACTAVQARFFGDAILRWNGSEWKEQTPEAPSGILNPEAWAVSCTSSTVCTVVGSYEVKVGAGFEGRPLAERWNGTKWEFVTTEAPNTSGAMYGLSCRSSGECTGVGAYFKPEGSEREQALIERYP